MTAIGFALYERLRTSPPSRHAMVGIEVDGFCEYDELGRDLIGLDFSGLMLADAIWQRLGVSNIVVPFVSGYHWIPFRHVR